jgi:general secretion pathway protein E/type IV pilus assembly protein PilB
MAIDLIEKTIKDNISTEIIQLISVETAYHFMIVPFEKIGTKLSFYVSNTTNYDDLGNELETLLGYEISLIEIPESEINKGLGKYYRKNDRNKKQSKKLELGNNNFLNTLIEEAIILNSSDIHIEPFEGNARIRFRIDGFLIERFLIDKSDYPSLINKIKIQSNLDIAEKRLPQDGRIFLGSQKTGKLDIRVSVLPTLHGEKAVLRLLRSSFDKINLNNLGFNEQALINYLEGVRRPHGMILISGPTGSGKTTTLYSTLILLNQIERNILTIEDPIEYTLEGINQVQLKESIGLDFPSALRTFLRQDPDVIMVGEIRDKETASMTIRASLTGHLVLSTIHTNSAWGIVARLIDMGIPEYLLADTLNTAVAQRLIRKLCGTCKEEETFDEKLYPPQYKPVRKVKFHSVPKGCEDCHYTGFRGRQAIYEVININHELSQYIKTAQMNIGKRLKELGHHTLGDNAFELFEAGITSINEVYPILTSDL